MYKNVVCEFVRNEEVSKIRNICNLFIKFMSPHSKLDISFFSGIEFKIKERSQIIDIDR